MPGISRLYLCGLLCEVERNVVVTVSNGVWMGCSEKKRIICQITRIEIEMVIFIFQRSFIDCHEKA